MRFLYCLFLLAYPIYGAAEKMEQQNSKSIYLIRHAEKQHDGTRNPSLTKVGELRANNVKELLKNKNITHIYSTNYKRTMETAEPLASKLGLPIKTYNPSDLQSFSKKLLKLKGNILVVGHSNTTPDLARLLGGKNIKDLNESEYEKVFLLKISNHNEHTVETVLLKSKPYQ